MNRWSQGRKARRHVLLAVIVSCLCTLTAHAETRPPFLAFSDLISGPDNGLDDGLGVGAIVTIWGFELGDMQGSSRVLFKDSAGVERTPAHIYYWKRADGQLPSGPANLFESHGMQEIAFSLPDGADGVGEIIVETISGRSNALRFDVRAGRFLHVMTTGSNDNPGTFAAPFRTVSEERPTPGETRGALNNAQFGDIFYVHDGVIDLRDSAGNAIDMSGLAQSLPADLRTPPAAEEFPLQFAVVAYPGGRATSNAAVADGDFARARATQFFETTGAVFSKYVLLSGNQDEPADDAAQANITEAEAELNRLPRTSANGIRSTAFGRAVGNYISEVAGKCSSSESGAINSNATSFDNVSHFIALGNMIEDWGCNRSSHFGHTTYMTVRANIDAGDRIPGQPNRVVAAWELSWNYLKNNQMKFGLHNFDQPLNGECSDVSGTLRMNNNVIVGQRGAAITFQSQNGGDTCWTADFEAYNNVMIDVGLGPVDENGINSNAINIVDNTSTGTVRIYNNLIYNWSDQNRTGPGAAFGERTPSSGVMTVDIRNNIVYTDQAEVVSDNYPLTRYDGGGDDTLSGEANIWFYSGVDPTGFAAPAWDASPITADPLVTLDGVRTAIDEASPARNGGVDTTAVIPRDLYGLLRANCNNIGPVKFREACPGVVTGVTVN